MSSDEKVQEVGAILAEYMDRISEFFTPNMRVALVAFYPGKSESELVLASEDISLDDIIAVVQRRRDSDNTRRIDYSLDEPKNQTKTLNHNDKCDH